MTPEQRIEEIDRKRDMLGDEIKTLNAQQIKASDAAEYYRDQKGGLIQQRDALLDERAELCSQIARDKAAAAERRKSDIAWAVFAVLIAGAMFIPLALVH